ncbi:MAG: hypothetical protein LH473_10165 [Chitinophagales bacterium]|nr:hypothetical protein [Chitinophagales bacterium]
MNKWSKVFASACIGFLFLLHLPFLRADPDYNLSIGRDAFTDEGLNTSQLRNYINHSYLSFDECDNLIKTPLFNLYLFLPLKIFGEDLIVARLSILFFLLLVLFVFASNGYLKKVIPFLILTTFIQYYVFQYSHFSLSEMMAIGFILLGLLSIYKYYDTRKIWYVITSATALSLAYYTKIQFAYIILLLPIALVILCWFDERSIVDAVTSKSFILALGVILFFTVLYYFFWLQPHSRIFILVMNDQSTGKFAEPGEMIQTIGFNIIHSLFSFQMWVWNSLSIVCLACGIYIHYKKTDRNFTILFVLSLLWMILECHKLTMIYLPSRYMVSFYVASGFMCSIVLQKMVSMKNENKFLFQSAIILCLLFLSSNTYQYLNLLKGRKYEIENINQYISSSIKNSTQPILGPWATNATWNSKAQCIPVWKDFMNDKNIFETFNPQAILSEPDEAESNQAYSSQGINLVQASDSSRVFHIGKWDVIVYWIKQ